MLEAYDFENKWGSLTKLAKRVNRATNVVTEWKTRGIPEEIFSNASLDTGFNKVWLQEGSGQKKRERDLLEFPRSATVREESVDAPHITDTGVQPYVGDIRERAASRKNPPAEGGATGGNGIKGP